MVQSPSYRQKKAHNEYHFVPSCRKTKSSPLTWPKNGPSLPPGPIGQREQARAELDTAMALYRTMDMTFWLPQAEAVLIQVNGCEETRAG